jgi:hypothetical protein
MDRRFDTARKRPARRLVAKPFRWSKSKYPSKIDSIIGSSLSWPGIGAKIREYKLRKAWAGVVGPAISKNAAPERLIGKTLYCNVSTAPWMTELNYQKRAIMDGLNSKVASVAVTEIIFRHGPVPKPVSPPKRVERISRVLGAEELRFIEEIVSPIKDPELRAVVKRAIITAKS